MTLLHGSCVAVGAAGCLILGASGSGKSRLCLAMMALGADLVADDQVALEVTEAGLVARAPARLSGLVEARGIGLLRVPSLSAATLGLVVDLDAAEPDRLPPRRMRSIEGIDLPLVCGQGHPDLAPALLALLRGWREC
ncbi:HPr kinase/phosphorylase [Oceanomicrobium pacificus]|uniref:Serine kinase n=1 Tax=Oceanomicrobium pacificus TaxID=2692916 RepID=A0A6B0TQ76_9RHOB|nr:HPr kinase/phosphatase C-terminal domain-containing protein [Oceanomicrobium pacificus]MXU63945.1 serine kinase [Oceanomicrobium pacificus]